MYRWSGGGIELQALLFWFPVFAFSAAAEAVVQWNLGSDLAFQVKVVPTVRSPLTRAAGCSLGTGLCIAAKTQGCLSLGPKKRSSNFS